MSDQTTQRRSAGKEDLAVAEKPRQRRLRRFAVVMLNDDYTPMGFVVWVLMRVFHLPADEAERRMLQVHHEGRSIVGTFVLDVARTKVAVVHELAEQQGHPLRCELAAVEEG
jgi:ATP-dependent Clp protease adaptor protein ClpS